MANQADFSFGGALMSEFSTLSIENPRILLAVFLILPVLLFLFVKFKKITEKLASSQNQKNLSSLKISLFLRTLFRALALISALLALSEISFGSKKIPVHKSGSNVSFVFDISYSMLAKDAPSRLTRLDAVKIYASSLLEHLSQTSFSAVLAKGDGFTAIPETEDVLSMLNLLENLSPSLMSSGGSSLGKGIEAALNAIPQNSAKSQYIWVFTDGDETDSRLEKSLEQAAKSLVPVTIVGFGSEKEIEITAGDGKTKVKTALRAEKMQEITESVNEGYSSFSFSGRKSQVSYIDSRAKASAWQLLSQIKGKAGENEENSLSYEVKKVNRHAFFIFWTVIFLILSFVAAEFKFSAIKNKKFLSLLEKSLVFTAVFLLASCKSEKKQILEGAWEWYEGKYTQATADFLTVAHKASEDSLAKNYAIFDLSATYFSMGELDASLKRLSQLNLDDEALSPDLRTAAFYNLGLISARKNDYETAAKNFKRAILADSKNVRAKINLELCQREITQKQAQEAQAEMQGVNEEKQTDPDMKNEIFNLIRENEGKKWRNMSDGGEKNDDVLDY